MNAVCRCPLSVLASSRTTHNTHTHIRICCVCYSGASSGAEAVAKDVMCAREATNLLHDALHGYCLCLSVGPYLETGSPLGWGALLPLRALKTLKLADEVRRRTCVDGTVCDTCDAWVATSSRWAPLVEQLVHDAGGRWAVLQPAVEMSQTVGMLCPLLTVNSLRAVYEYCIRNRTDPGELEGAMMKSVRNMLQCLTKISRNVAATVVFVS